LPQGEWVDYWTDRRVKGGALIQADAPLDVVPMYVRAGAIIPMGPEMNYVGEKPFDPLTLVVYPDAKGDAAARVYEDDGATQGYRQGVFRRTSVSVARSGGEMQIKIGAPEGSYNAGARGVTVIVKSAPRVTAVSLDGKPLAAAGGGRPPGWSKSGDELTIQIADDGKAHTIQLR
jgi:alpha-glucosidase (family GH31 glycosyl hydrolase)